MNTDGVAKLVSSGLGAGVLSHHMINKLKSKKAKLHIFSGTRTPMVNQISLASLKKKTLSRAASELLIYLREESNLLLMNEPDFLFLQASSQGQKPGRRAPKSM